MQEIIVEMVKSLNEGISGPNLAALENQYGKTPVRFALMQLVSWLKTQGAEKRHVPLPLEPDRFIWHKKLKEIVLNSQQLGSLFEITNEVLDFSENIPPEQSAEIASYVDRSYQPKLRT